MVEAFRIPIAESHPASPVSACAAIERFLRFRDLQGLANHQAAVESEQQDDRVKLQ